MNAKMTPGPWVACGSDTSVATWVERNGKRVCTMQRGDEDWDNAQFIAASCNAANALADALRMLISDAEDVAGGTYLNYRLLLSERIKRARAALERAKVEA